MKKYLVVLSVSIFGWPALAGMNSLFKDMLVLGASVSADHSAPSPGRVVAEQARMDNENLVLKATNGKKSTYHASFIRNRVSQLSPDITVAIDLFFHDYKIPKPFLAKDAAWMRESVGVLAIHSEILILGTALGFSGIGAAEPANNLIRELAEQYDNIIVIDINSIFLQLHSLSGYSYDINGVQLTLYRNQVMADAIHPNELGTKMLGNLIIKELRDRNPDITDAQLPYSELEVRSMTGRLATN